MVSSAQLTQDYQYSSLTYQGVSTRESNNILITQPHMSKNFPQMVCAWILTKNNPRFKKVVISIFSLYGWLQVKMTNKELPFLASGKRPSGGDSVLSWNQEIYLVTTRSQVNILHFEIHLIMDHHMFNQWYQIQKPKNFFRQMFNWAPKINFL